MSRDNYHRKRPAKILRNKVLVLCGGESERLYFSHYKAKLRTLKNVTVEVLAHKKSDPLSLVQEAAKRKADYHEVWAVFDKDNFRNFDTAIACSGVKGVECAFSNRSIEYWFLLHFKNRTGSMNQQELETELGKKLGFKYGKSEDQILKACKAMEKKLEHAEERAKAGHERHKRDSGDSPSDWRSCTTVYHLTKRLREWKAAT